jgi:hypothetical protein
MTVKAESIQAVQELIEEKRQDAPVAEFLKVLITTYRASAFGDQKESARERVLKRGLVARRELENAEGGSYSSEKVAELLGYKHRQGVDYQREQKNLVAWKSAVNKWRYPVWQFQDQKPLPGIKECLRALDSSDGWAQIIFFLSPRCSTDNKRPLDLLRKSQVEEAVAAAHRHGEHGAS